MLKEILTNRKKWQIGKMLLFCAEEMQKANAKRYGVCLQDCIKHFHVSIAAGPVYVCTCCHQTWFREGVSFLRKTSMLLRDKNIYCTNITSVANEEWICHTCLSSLKDGKIQTLYVENGTKLPEKPQELMLHQLEERLLALRIPFMQIRQLPRGGQHSIRGNVINVQPVVNSLPMAIYLFIIKVRKIACRDKEHITDRKWEPRFY